MDKHRCDKVTWAKSIKSVQKIGHFLNKTKDMQQFDNLYIIELLTIIPVNGFFLFFIHFAQFSKSIAAFLFILFTF